jgi:hypothetical protein
MLKPQACGVLAARDQRCKTCPKSKITLYTTMKLKHLEKVKGSLQEKYVSKEKSPPPHHFSK